jgi:HD-GYP domain-containing protein (c-di-GMP phosphodiesterase class II)
MYNLISDGLFLSVGIGLLLFYGNMLYLHIIVISLMIVMLIKCYYQGVLNGLSWLSLIILSLIALMFKNGVFTNNELSEIMLILIPSVIVGLLAEKQRRYVKQLKETYLSALKALAEATDARDSYTQGHSERVAKYAVSMAKELSLSEREINSLEQAALLHDIGKIAIPDKILHKTGPLDESDWSIMRRHPEHGQRILSKLSFLSETLPLVLYHHIRFDKEGYPAKKKSVKIPLTARILTVADAFDAMTSDRAYRSRLSVKQALEELEKCSGTQFDPEAVKALKKKYSEMDNKERLPRSR